MRFQTVQRVVALLALLTFTSTPLAVAGTPETLRTEQDSKAKAGLEAALVATPVPSSSTATGLEETPARARIARKTLAVLEAAGYLDPYGATASLINTIQDLEAFLTGEETLDQLAAGWPEPEHAVEDAAVLATIHHFVPDAITSHQLSSFNDPPNFLQMVVQALSTALQNRDPERDQDIATRVLDGWGVKTPDAVVAYAVATKRWLGLLGHRLRDPMLALVIIQPKRRETPLVVIGPECHDTPLAGLAGLSQFVLVAEPGMTWDDLAKIILARGRRTSWTYVGNNANYEALQHTPTWGNDIHMSQRIEISHAPVFLVLTKLLTDLRIDPTLWNPADLNGSDKQLRQYLNDLETRRQA